MVSESIALDPLRANGTRPVALGSHDPFRFHQQLRGRAAERPHDEVPSRLPVALRTVHHQWFTEGLFKPSWSKRLTMAKWLIRGKAEMGIDGRWVSLEPGQVAIYMPSIRHQFRGLAEVNEFCWFSVDGPVAEQFVLELGLTPGVFDFGPAPMDQIDEMMVSLKDSSQAGRRRSSLLAISAWYGIASRIASPKLPTEVEQAKRIIQQEFGTPDLSAESIADRLHYHRGSFSRLFRRHTGMTLMDYMTEVRLQQAKALLLHSDHKVSEIARRCGFSEATYFCRWFRKHAGGPPGAVRKVASIPQ